MTGLQEATRQITEGIDILTNLTCGPADQLEHPADVGDVVTGLSRAVSRVPPLLGQLAAFLEVENVSGTIVRRDGTGASSVVRAVSDALHRAGQDAEAMAAALATAGMSCQQLALARAGLTPSPASDIPGQVPANRADDRHWKADHPGWPS